MIAKMLRNKRIFSAKLNYFYRCFTGDIQQYEKTDNLIAHPDKFDLLISIFVL